MAVDPAAEPLGPVSQAAPHSHVRALADVRRHLLRSVGKLLVYGLVVYAVLRLIPALKQALHSLEQVSWEWVVGAVVLEILSETGFVICWRDIVDPDHLLERDGRGRRMDQRVAWTQLGGGLLVPGGSLGGMGVGGWILHRFGMPTDQIAERQFNLSFLNTTVDALVLIVFGLGLGIGVFVGRNDLVLSLVPAAVAAVGLTAALLVARRLSVATERRTSRHPKVTRSLRTLARAVDNTEHLVFSRRNWKTVLAALAYLGFDLLILWFALLAVHANPTPAFAPVVMAYIIGALGGSLPLPASLGTVGGIAGMLIAYGVHHDAAVAAVLLHQAIGLLVPLAGGAISYRIIRRRVGPVPRSTA